MSDRPCTGFAHHHSDEALRRWRRVTPEAKLRWLHETLELTRAMLPPARRRTWLMMRCEEPGASVAIERLTAEWPAFSAGVNDGAAGVEAFVRDLVAREASSRGAREILLALREWLSFSAGPSAVGAAGVDEALRQLG